MERMNAGSIARDLRNRVVQRSLPTALLTLALASAVTLAQAETCTTQSAMAPAVRDALAATARTLAARVAANDASALRSAAAPDLAKDFGALQYLVAVT